MTIDSSGLAAAPAAASSSWGMPSAVASAAASGAGAGRGAHANSLDAKLAFSPSHHTAELGRGCVRACV